MTLATHALCYVSPDPSRDAIICVDCPTPGAARLAAEDHARSTLEWVTGSGDDWWYAGGPDGDAYVVLPLGMES